MKKTKNEQYKEFLELLEEKSQNLVTQTTQTTYQVDWEYWLAMDEWKLEDAVLLYLGRDPSNPSIVDDSDINKTKFEVIEKRSKLINISKSGIKTGNLKVRSESGLNDFCEMIVIYYVKPEIFIKYLKSKTHLEIPQELENWYAQNQEEKITLQPSSAETQKINLQKNDSENESEDGRTTRKLKRQIDILGKALSLIKNNNEDCKDKMKKISGSGIYSFMKKNEKSIWPNGDSPLLSKDKTERLLNEYLKKIF